MPITIAVSGTITGLSAGGLPANSITSASIADNAITSGKLASGVGGKILQVVSNHVTEKLSQNCATETWLAFSELDTSITPSAATSKILISGWLNVSISSAMNVFIKLRRGSTDIGVADQVGNRRQATASATPGQNNWSQAIPFFFIDSPNTTSSTTYTLQLSHPSSSTRTLVVNADDADSDDSDVCRVTSNIILQEVAA